MKKRDDAMKARINSFQSMGAVDGPGIRYVIFMQGCPLRCVYCHNPETWSLDGSEYELEDIYHRILRCKPYFGETGGVTISGGEPLLQWEFVSQMFEKLQKDGIHTALDTSGIGDMNGAREILKHTDLVLCDLKFPTEEKYRNHCKGDLKKVLEFLDLTDEMKIPLWIRHVVVPGMTDSRESVMQIVNMAKRYSNLKKVELLPFKKLCVSKYESLGIPFQLADCQECSNSVVLKLSEEIIKS